MREYRGKRKDNGEWVYGFLVGENYIGEYKSDGCGRYSWNVCNVVDPETIGQHTGLYDKDKTPIYEGDIIKIDGSFTIYQDSVGVVKFKKGIFYVETTRYGKEQDYIIDERLDKIIGSIHENPELLHKDLKS